MLFKKRQHLQLMFLDFGCGASSFSYIPLYVYTHVIVLQILLQKYERNMVVG